MSADERAAKVSSGEVRHLIKCYQKDLRTETQASETVRDSIRKMISILKELLTLRRKP